MLGIEIPVSHDESAETLSSLTMTVRSTKQRAHTGEEVVVVIL